jgi:phosphatidylethanolamine/phosphatidyl-N-methylethanolamine N-methyltransferase
MAQPGELDREAIAKAYARWAPVYDLVFDMVMATGRRAAAAAAVRAGPSVLDVGVGTGLELPYFHADSRVIGVDLSEPMLRKARARVSAKRLAHVRGLCVMDGARLAFDEATFDAVVAPYVITVVPSPEATLDEFARVVRPGGEIILVNHVGAESGPRATIERWLARQTHHLGWRPEFPWAQLEDWYSRHDHVELIERRTLPPFSLFTLVRFRRRAQAGDIVKAA